ncbi:MAG: B12-binding domain-containing radical SAM protein, partial [Candidatus Omnitrophica bacterium]|nr:B12-binding domain-containing radical SAM protein [Candidatus Omnitrophota bacterium]
MRKINKILLIQPPFTIMNMYPKSAMPPLGLGYIAAVLKNKYEVKILDAAVEGYTNVQKIDERFIRYGLSFEEIEKRIVDFAPDVVGVSCQFIGQAQNALEVCRRIKASDQNIITVIGGPFPSSTPHYFLKERLLDAVVIGEGEATIVRLLKALKEEVGLSNIDGLAFRVNETIQINPLKDFISDLDTLPFPARELMPMEKYFKINSPHGGLPRKRPNTSIITSRGCPAKCVFCATAAFWGNRFRSRSPENVLEELKMLKDEYGVREV